MAAVKAIILKDNHEITAHHVAHQYKQADAQHHDQTTQRLASISAQLAWVVEVAGPRSMSSRNTVRFQQRDTNPFRNSFACFAKLSRKRITAVSVNNFHERRATACPSIPCNLASQSGRLTCPFASHQLEYPSRTRA